jgi:hypothetical protein
VKTISQPTFWFRLGCGGSALSLLTLVLAFPAQAQAPLDPARLERLLAEGRAAHEQSVSASGASLDPLVSIAPQFPDQPEDPTPTALPYAPELWAHFPLLITLLDPEVALQLEQALAQLEPTPDLALQPDTPLPTGIPVDLDQLRIQRLLAEGAAAYAEQQRAQSSPSGVETAEESSPDTVLIASTASLATGSLSPQSAPDPSEPAIQVADASPAPAPLQAPATDPNQLRIQRLLEEGAAAHAGLTAPEVDSSRSDPAREAVTPAGFPPSPPLPEAAPIARTQQVSQPTTTAAALLSPQGSPVRLGSVPEPDALQEWVAILLGIDQLDPNQPLPTFVAQAEGTLPLPSLQPATSPYSPDLLRLFPLTVDLINPLLDPLPNSPLDVRAGDFPTDLADFEFIREGLESTTAAGSQGSLYDPQLLELFPLLTPSGSAQATAEAETATDPQTPRGSQIRQALEVSTQLQRPLDPSQLNVEGDVLSYDAEGQVGIAEGNARIQLADGTTISGDRLLFYQRERRLRSDGPFVLNQPVGSGRQQARQIQGQNLDFDLPSRTAQFESSLVIVPAEQPGTFMYVRSEETTALLGDRIFFEKATVTTSPEEPITHYVQGDRVEIFPDDRVLIYDARVFAGGEQDPVGDISGGTQVGYFPLFVYSLRDHQWVLPGQSEEEGVFVKSSWAYHMDQYNFGGLRIDAIQNKGLGLGVVHDYILPIPDSTNYGRAQFYIVTEADEDRLSNRFRVDHFFDFYAATILGHPGQLRGQVQLNFDNTYRPTGGRNDNADFRLNSTYQADLSTTTLNISRTGSPERGTYTLPVTLNHRQQYGDARWLTSDLRIDYNQRLNVEGAQDFADARLTLGTQARPPGWLGSYQINYRAYSSSNGDNESRRNFEFNFTPNALQLGRGISFNTNLSATQNQQPNFEEGGLNYFNKYEARSSLRFNQYQPMDWLTLNPGSIDYYQAVYSTPENQESTVSFNPRLTVEPNDWSSLDVRFQRVFQGNNSVPFQSVSSTSRETHRFNANFSAFTPRANLPNVPPGFIAFEDDLPGESPIPLVFADDTPEDRVELAERTTEELEADVRNLFRFDTSTGFDYTTDRWDLVNASFTWNTSPSLFDVRLQTGYDPNEGELRPVRLSYTGRTTTTFDRNLRAGLSSYEPGFAYSLQAIYDPETGDLPTYGLDLDFTIGTQWQNHWRVRFGLDEEGIRRLEVRRDLRDFELRFAYDPQAELLLLEGILVAFPSRPVGLTQERGDFILNAPTTSFGSGGLLP